MNRLLDTNFLDNNLEQLPYHEIANCITMCDQRLAQQNNAIHMRFLQEAKVKLEQERNKRIAVSFLKR